MAHRERIRHDNDPRHCHELTFSCHRRMPLLTSDDWRSLPSEAIDRATQQQGHRLTAFVYMPEHVHLLVYRDAQASDIDALLRAITRPFAFRIKQTLVAACGTLLQRLTIRQRPGVETFRYWQEGPGYDRNIDNAATALAAIEYIHLNPVRRRLVASGVAWQWSSLRWYQQLSYEVQVRVPKPVSLLAAFLDAGR